MYTIIILLWASLLATGAQAQNSENVKYSMRCLENAITSALDCGPNEQTASALQNIRTNLVVSRTFHDNLNGRELQNMYVCWRSAFDEVVLLTPGLNPQQTDRQSGAQADCFVPVQKAGNALARNARNLTEQTKNVDEFVVLVQDIEKAAGDFLSLPEQDAGQFVQAVDTLAHFIQTRFQHDANHADQYAKSSTTLIKAIVAQQHPLDLRQAIAVLLVEIRNIASLAQSDLNESAQAHVNLFLSGFTNLLNILRSPSRPSLEFCVQMFQRVVESIFDGRDDVKQALAIQALRFKKSALGFGRKVNYTHLQNIQRATTNEIKQDFVDQVLWATSTRDCRYIPVMQSINVQLQNAFRLSHEENLQTLFVHLTDVLMQIPTGEPLIDVLQQFLIESYRSGAAVTTTAFFRKLLIYLQRMLLNNYLK